MAWLQGAGAWHGDHSGAGLLLQPLPAQASTGGQHPSTFPDQGSDTLPDGPLFCMMLWEWMVFFLLGGLWVSDLLLCASCTSSSSFQRGRPLRILSQDGRSLCQGALCLIVMLHIAECVLPGAGIWGSEAGG